MDKKTIVCFGDSNTHGYDAVTGGRFAPEVRWPGRLQALLGQEYLVREEGLSGRTTVFEDPLFEGLCGLTAITPVLLTHEPVDLLIVMLGTNDVKSRFACNPGNLGKAMERMLQKAMDRRDAWRDGLPHILVIAPPPIGEGYADTDVFFEMGECCAEKSAQLAGQYRDVAERLGCAFLDAAQIPGVVMNQVDYMHLTPEAHGALAEKTAQVIREWAE